MKSQGIPISGIYPVLPARVVSAGIKSRTARRDASSGVSCSSNPSGGKNGRQNALSPGLMQIGTGSRFDKRPRDGRVFWPLIGSILPTNHKAGQDGLISGPYDRGNGFSGMEAQQGHKRSHSQSHILYQGSEWRHPSITRVRRAGMARWLPGIASFLITGIVIGAVVWMTVIELAVIFGRPN